jgi:hypothetical protein
MQYRKFDMSCKLSFALISFLLCLDVRAANLCEIDHVENTKDGIRVIFNNDHHPNILGIKRSASQKMENVTAGSPLVLKEGDESGINEGPHDFCTLKAEKREGKLGILAKANNHIPGIVPTDRSEFILPVK